MIGQPFGFLRPFSNRSVYNGLFRSFTASSNVRRTICGVCSTGIPPEWKLYTKLYTKSNRFAFPSLDNFNSFRNQKECSNPSFVHSHIYYTIYPKNLRVAKRSLLPELFMQFPIPDLPSFHPKILLSYLRFRFDQINKHDRSALPRIHVTRRAFDFEDRNRERRTREITSEADLFHFRPVILCVTLE